MIVNTPYLPAPDAPVRETYYTVDGIDYILFVGVNSKRSFTNHTIVCRVTPFGYVAVGTIYTRTAGGWEVAVPAGVTPALYPGLTLTEPTSYEMPQYPKPLLTERIVDAIRIAVALAAVTPPPRVLVEAAAVADYAGMADDAADDEDDEAEDD